MIGLIVIVSLVVFAVIAPLLVLRKYYRPSKFKLWQNIFWIAITIISWPLVPIVLAARRNDKIMLSIFWGSFIIMAVAVWYWSILNVSKLIQFQQYLQHQV